MPTEQLFIPELIKVGFQGRQGTYTGKLAYIIYFDAKGTLRKEASWEGWRDKDIEPQEFTNEPTDGFVLNKGVGGQRESYGWNARNEYIRVFDPRGFEFEISVSNLLFILRECDCSRGKGLEGKFVYAWDRTELVLLPVSAQDYKVSKDFTSLQSQSVKAKELTPGASYITRKQETLTYVGKFDYHFVASPDRDTDRPETSRVMKKFVFWDGNDFVYLNDVKSIAVLNSETVSPDYAELVDRYNKSAHGSKVVRLYLKEERQTGKWGKVWAFEKPEGSGVFVICSRYGEEDKDMHTDCKYFMVGDRLNKQNCYSYKRKGETGYIERTNIRLFAELESGAEVRVKDDTFSKGHISRTNIRLFAELESGAVRVKDDTFSKG